MRLRWSTFLALLAVTSSASVAAVSVVTMSVATAQEVSRNKFALGASVGTLGVGVEASYLVYDYLAVRAVATGLSLNSTEIVSYFGGSANSEGDFDVTGTSAGLLFDLHPFADGWRLTAGVRYFDFELDANSGTYAGTQRLGNNPYTFLQTGNVTRFAKNSNSAAPYVGFGYDAAHYLRDGSRFTLGFEIGALYAGQPDVRITTENTSPALAADVALEEETLKKDLQRFYRFYPVAMFSGKVSF